MQHITDVPWIQFDEYNSTSSSKFNIKTISKEEKMLPYK